MGTPFMLCPQTTHDGILASLPASPSWYLVPAEAIDSGGHGHGVVLTHVLHIVHLQHAAGVAGLLHATNVLQNIHLGKWGRGKGGGREGGRERDGGK